MTTPIVITGIGPICSEAFSLPELLASGSTRAPGHRSPRPMTRFDPERFLGKRGYKFLSAGTRYALAAARLALEDAGLWETTDYPRESRGVFLGTNFGVHDVVDAMDGVVLSEGSAALMAIETPNFSVNIPASYVSLKCGFEAFNVTLTDTLVAGLESVVLAAQGLRSGRAQMALAGAAEGPVPAHAAAVLGGAPSEGAACMVTLETGDAAHARGARAYAQVGPHVLCFIPPDAAASRDDWQPYDDLLRGRLDALLTDRAPSTVTVAALDSPFNRRIDESVLRYLHERSIPAPVRAVPADACVSPMLWLAAAIARDGDGLLLVASPQGHVALLSMEPVGSGRAAAQPERARIPAERPALV